MVFEIDPAEEGELDRAEGYRSGYDKREVVVTSQRGEAIDAMMYCAEPSAVVGGRLPYTWYKNSHSRGISNGVCRDVRRLQAR